MSSRQENTLLGSEDDNKNLGMQEIIQSIENNYGTFPAEALKAIIGRKEEAAPVLLDVLRKVLEDPHKYEENPDYFAHIYAAFLLAQFRVTEAYPILVELMKLPRELTSGLFVDTMDKAGGRIFASVYNGDIKPLKELVNDKDLGEDVRGAAIKALSILALYGVLSRDEVIEYYRALLTGGMTDEDGKVTAKLIYCCNSLYPEELMEEIKAACQKYKFEARDVDLEFIEGTLELGKEWALEDYRLNSDYQYIDDTIDELRWWDCFDHEPSAWLKYIEDKLHNNRQTPTLAPNIKTGRNDPCPCGSGKKYKKCCGK